MANALPKVVVGRGKRLGRGYGSGKGGHTSGRGQKGQKSRGSVGVLFEGFKVRKSFVKRLPLVRGKDKFKPYPKPVVVKLVSLEQFAEGTTVTADMLIEKGLVAKSDAKRNGVKIVGGGTLTKKLTIALPITKKAALEIEKLGGQVTGAQLPESK